MKAYSQEAHENGEFCLCSGVFCGCAMCATQAHEKTQPMRDEASQSFIYVSFAAGEHIRFWTRDKDAAHRFARDTGAAVEMFQRALP